MELLPIQVRWKKLSPLKTYTCEFAELSINLGIYPNLALYNRTIRKNRFVLY